MTEGEWLASTDPEPMLIFRGDEASVRKLGLYACACCRLIWRHITDERSRRAVEVAERFHDDQAGVRELGAAHASAEEFYRSLTRAGRDKDAARAAARAASASAAWDGPEAASWVAAWDGEPARASAKQHQADLLRDILGNPFRPAPTVNPFWLRWNDGTVVKLAQAIYDERRFEDLPILADALEDAGCDNEDILRHCREPGEHVRGCWVVDLLLGKE